MLFVPTDTRDARKRSVAKERFIIFAREIAIALRGKAGIIILPLVLSQIGSVARRARFLIEKSFERFVQEGEWQKRVHVTESLHKITFFCRKHMTRIFILFYG